MSLPFGTIHSMLVDGQTDEGYIVTKGQFNGFLANEEAGKELHVGSIVDVFVYQNKQGKTTLTAKLPEIVLGSYAWAEVTGIFPALGVFVKISPTIDVLVSKDDMPYVFKAWPREGDRLYITLKLDREDRLLGQTAKDNFFQDNMYRHASMEIPLNQAVTGVVIRAEKEGAVIYTEEGYRGFVHHSEMERPVRLGEAVTGRIIEVKENGSVNISLRAMKHERLDDDAERIYAHLERAGGDMPFGDKSDADAIRQTFGISKSAFKRALGRLMRAGRVEQVDGIQTKTTEKNAQDE